MGSGRTTKRVQCPGCGNLLRPTHQMLMGRGGAVCECGFGAGAPAPPPFEVAPPPRRGPTVGLLGLGTGLFVAGSLAEVGVWFGWAPLHGGVAAALALAGLLAAGWGGWWWWRRRRWFDSAALCEDASIRRALMTQVRRVFESAERNGAGQVDLFLAERGLTAPEFRAAVWARLNETDSAA